MQSYRRPAPPDPSRAATARLRTARLELNLPAPQEAELVVDYFIRNRAHLERWEPPRPPTFYTVPFWSERLQQNRWEQQQDLSLRLFLRWGDEPRGEVIGSCNFTNIIRGAFQACHLGYGVDARCEGQGLMREALEAAISHVFEVLRLHRIQANYQPVNERSAGLLKRLGFHVEGYARDYLFIDGAWRDHILTSLIRAGA